MIYGITGKQRNGKTLFMTEVAFDYYNKGFHIIANYKLTFPYIEFDEEMFYSDERIEAFKRKYKTNKFLVCLADAHLILSAHMARKDARKLYFITQINKILEEEGHFLYDTQRYEQMNKTLRNNTDMLMWVKKLSNKFEPLRIEIHILEDKMSYFDEVGMFEINEADIHLGLFERFGRTKLSENYTPKVR